MGALHVHNKSGKSTPRPEAINSENCRRVSTQEATARSPYLENCVSLLLMREANRQPSATRAA